MNVRIINTDEIKLLFQFFDYNDPDEMIAENTRDINKGKIDIFGLFQDGNLIGEIYVAYVHSDERFAVRNKRVYLFAFRVHGTRQIPHVHTQAIPSAEIDQRRVFYSYYPFQGITGTSEVSSLKK